MRPDAAPWYANTVRMAARVARFRRVSSFFMMIPALIGTLVTEPPVRTSRTGPARSAQRQARPGAGRYPGEGCRRCPVPTPACAGEANCGPRHCHSVSQLRTPPGDTRPGRPGQRAQRSRAPARNSPAHGNVAVGRRPPWFGFFQPSWGARATQTVRRWRPLSRRDFRMARPARVDMRLRKPCVLARLRVFGW